ncbi:alpha-L-rhamnosidase N-terminal domain-containing protein [Plectosphaerella cucumerina]|uniref:Alpha-L-rhamnosidase N-terminal domain-containing protein n=1 Tax=Plectosphaerella cucumerina TaxID=40658 RepID=A0A8K0TFB2_9PEZI|nr:alpha-L-rhamnosidase N-terminal domain-containing protein [Plectosphaerella cucumerina]
MAVRITRIKFEHHREALGIHEPEPRPSWRFAGTVCGWQQHSYDIEVCRETTLAFVKNVFTVESGESQYVEWPDRPLEARERAIVRVRAHGGHEQPSTPWSQAHSVETGLLSAEDSKDSVPISSTLACDFTGPKRPIYFRKEFATPASIIIASARLYITALGMYEPRINGRSISDHVLAPGWQSYNSRHVYNTFDVTDVVRSGHNAIGVVVGEGWFSGHLGYMGGQRNVYGETLGILARLVVSLADGSLVEVPTNETWLSNTGPIILSEIYRGEAYDSRLESAIAGWSSPGFDASGWSATSRCNPLKGLLVASDGPPVRRIDERKPVRLFTSPSGKQLVDFGQNLVGWVRICVSGPEGSQVTLRYAEDW